MWTRLPLRVRGGLFGLAAALLVFLVVTRVAALPVGGFSAGALPVNPLSPPDVTVRIVDLQFSPKYVRIPPGTKVIWRNDDTTPHRVVADDGTWDSLVLSPGEEFSWSFTAPGIVRYHCAIHEEMRGTLSVSFLVDLPLIVRNWVGRPTWTPTATPTPTATATWTPTATPTLYWKAGGWKDYAPSGVPDFDQKQDKWGLGVLGAPGWQWTYCGPVAVANSLWWFDSKFEPNPMPPSTIHDGYGLVTAYAATWDDHDPNNVDNPNTPPGPGGEFVEDLGWRMDTDGQRTGTAHKGTNVITMHQAIQKYLNDHGLGGWYSMTLQKQPGFDWVAREVLRSEDVILLLGFWELRATGDWERIGGHYVTVAGVSQQGNLIAFSDPYRDNAEVGGPGRVLPAPHMPPHPATLHNDAAYVSHDIWSVVQTDSPGGIWGPAGYASASLAQEFAYQNVPDEFAPLTGSYMGGPLQVEVEYAIAVSPVDQTPTPTATPTSTPTATHTPTPTPQPPSIVVFKLDTAFRPLPGWTMTLFSGSECFGIPLAEKVTDGRGLADFTGLLPSVYSVLERQQPGYEAVSPLCQTIDLNEPVPASAGLRPLVYPPADRDSFPSGADMLIELNGIGPVNATLNGPTIVQRGDPADDDGDGLTEIQTEIVSMNLTGVTQYGPVSATQSQTRPSHGLVKQQTQGADYPAESFFDVFVELSTPLGPLHNQDPVRVQTIIDAIPPILAFYQTVYPAAVPLYNANGYQVGFIRYVVHIPLPPREKLVIFINRPLVSR